MAKAINGHSTSKSVMAMAIMAMPVVPSMTPLFFLLIHKLLCFISGRAGVGLSVLTYGVSPVFLGICSTLYTSTNFIESSDVHDSKQACVPAC